jgi:signal transduction histidine kinase
MLVTETLRLIGLAAGAALYVLLAGLVVQRRKWWVLAALGGAAAWYAAGAAGLFWKAATGLTVVGWREALQGLAVTGAVGAAAGAVASLVLARRVTGPSRQFRRALAASLAAPAVASAVAGPESAALVFAGLAPGLVLARFVYRYNVLGLRMSPRLLFAVRLGVVFAFYLLLVKRATDILEDEFDAFRQLVELALIFAATLVWVPLYGWMTRFLSQRTQLYADFSKRAIEEAARILDLGERVQFLAAQVRRTFGLHRVWLITGEVFAGEGAEAAREELEKLAADAALGRIEVLHAGDHPRLARLGFGYLFPLWYEDRLNGLLLADCSPRMYLDENEAVLLGLSRQISHSIETCRLVDDKIRLETTLVQQEHLAGLGKVAATIAHEIKNPLSSIKTLVQLMGEDPAMEQQYGRDLKYVVAEIDRLNRSVQQLLTFSRPAPEAEGEVDVSELLEATAGVLAREYEAAQIRIERRIEPRLRLLRGSPEMIKQVVLNLALNAVQASRAGGAVTLEAGPGAAGRVRIAVSDQGPGIPADLREKIFEPFYTTKQKGTGLGLSIVRKNVRQMGGEIRVESPVENGGGTRFEVTLPVE